ncbi:MAG: right-handed parallel beta-helix repeat-containing protein [Planctomycetota bacterium]
MRFSPLAAITAATSLCVSLAGPALAGPLTPPAGAVAPTGETLTELGDRVEPRTPISQETTPGDAAAQFVITQAGSYYLTENILLLTTSAAIDVRADNVTLDLNGFTIAGLSPAGGTGIRATSQRAVTIRNGVLNGWENAVNCTSSFETTLEGLTSRFALDIAFRAGNESIIRDCRAIDAGNVGFFASVSTFVADSKAFNCAGDGFLLGSDSIVRDCRAIGNDRDGFRVNGTAVYERCVALNNFLNGFTGGSNTVMTSCTSTGNRETGIDVGFSSVVTDSVASENTLDGIDADSRCIVRGCTTGRNDRDGIRVDFGSSVIDSIASRNGADGIDASSNCRVEACSATENDANGIVIRSNSVAVGNLSEGNARGSGEDGTGIVATSSGAVIERNRVISNRRGIETTFDGCLVIGNIASDNVSDFVLVAGTRHGPIVEAGQTLVPINNTTAPGTLNTTDPHANIIY